MPAGKLELNPIVSRYCAILALVVASLGGPAMATPVGLIETFEGNAVGSFPAGWSDVALVDPSSTAPKPSAVVVNTADAFGNPTKAVATQPKVLGTLPSTGISQGIYRTIPLSSFYSSRADVRIDRFSDVTDFDCGCAPGLLAGTDVPVQVGFLQSTGLQDPFNYPNLGPIVSSRTRNWQLFVYTTNIQAIFDLGVPVTLGTWYDVQVDLDVLAGAVHTLIIDATTGATQSDLVTTLPAAWDPAVDGRFDIAAYFGGELTAVSVSSLVTIDNIHLSTTPIPEPTTMLLLGSMLAAGGVLRRRSFGCKQRRGRANGECPLSG